MQTKENRFLFSTSRCISSVVQETSSKPSLVTVSSVAMTKTLATRGQYIPPQIVSLTIH